MRRSKVIQPASHACLLRQREIAEAACNRAVISGCRAARSAADCGILPGSIIEVAAGNHAAQRKSLILAPAPDSRILRPCDIGEAAAHGRIGRVGRVEILSSAAIRRSAANDAEIIINRVSVIAVGDRIEIAPAADSRPGNASVQ